MSMTYETTHEGSGTVQDLLNRLNKLTMCMVQKPDDYMQRKRFLEALHDPLRRSKTPCDMTWVHVNLRYNIELLYLHDLYPQGYGPNQHVRFHLGAGTGKLLVINQQ